VMVNKEMMTNFAIELAFNGFIVANLDWSGHGQSTGALTNLTRDLESVLDDIPIRTPYANMSQLALLGFSMGGGPTYEYAINNTDVKAWVGVGTWADGRISNTSNPNNVLLIIGSLDEAVTFDDVAPSFVNLTGLSLDNIEPNVLYGNINDGSARKIQLVQGVDHLITPWSRDFVISSRNWIYETFYGSKPANFMVYDVRQVYAWMGLAGTIGLVFISAYILADKFNLLKKENTDKTMEEINDNLDDLEFHCKRILDIIFNGRAN